MTSGESPVPRADSGKSAARALDRTNGFISPSRMKSRPTWISWTVGFVCFLLFLGEYYAHGWRLNNEGLVVLGAGILLLLLPYLTEFKFLGIEGKFRELVETVHELEEQVRKSVSSLSGLGVFDSKTQATYARLRLLVNRFDSLKDASAPSVSNEMEVVATSILEFLGGNPEHAVACLPKLRVRIPETHYLVGAGHLRANPPQLDEAEREFKRLVEWGKSLEDGRLQAMGFMGQGLVKARLARKGEGRLVRNQAITLFDQAVLLNQEGALVHLNRAAAHCQNGDWPLCWGDLVSFKKKSGLSSKEVIGHVEGDGDKGFQELEALVQDQQSLSGTTWREKLERELEKAR